MPFLLDDEYHVFITGYQLNGKLTGTTDLANCSAEIHTKDSALTLRCAYLAKNALSRKMLGGHLVYSLFSKQMARYSDQPVTTVNSFLAVSLAEVQYVSVPSLQGYPGLEPPYTSLYLIRNLIVCSLESCKVGP